MATARNPDEVRDWLRDISDNNYLEETSPIAITRGQKGALIGTINRYVGGDENRYTVFAWLFGGDDDRMVAKSSKELAHGDWVALYEWANFYQDADGKWHSSATFAVELALVLTEAVHTFYKMSVKDQEESGLERDYKNLMDTSVSDLGGVVTLVDNGEAPSVSPSVSVSPSASETVVHYEYSPLGLSPTRFGTKHDDNF